MNQHAATPLERRSRRFDQATRRAITALVALCASLCFAQAASAPPAAAQSKPSERHLSDRWITSKVRAEMFAVSANQSIHVHIKTVRGAVTLTGKVASQDIALQFARAAKRPVGFKSVDASGLSVAAR